MAHPALAVTDTHALIWYGQKQARKLGPVARQLFEAVDRGTAAIYVPSLVVVEMGDAAARGSILLPERFEAWMERLFASNRFFPVDLTWDIIRRAERLRAIAERGDRLIAATAAHLGHPLITRDPAIAATAGVEVVW